MVWAEGGWRVTMTWKGVRPTCVFRRGLYRLDLSSASESGNVNVNVNVNANGLEDGASDGDDGVHVSYHESGNARVHFSTMNHVVNCHLSSDLCGLSRTGSWLSLLSWTTIVSPRCLLRPTGNIYPERRSLYRSRTGCRHGRHSLPFFPVSRVKSQKGLFVALGCSHGAQWICGDSIHPRC